tara:strand:+ start:1214 stop:1423 length:210 start_codon:yes stop_codon:yes gene_type:complete
MEINVDMAAASRRYAELSDQEKEIIRKFMNSPVRDIIRKLFGNELDKLLGNFMLPMSERGKGLATRQRP